MRGIGRYFNTQLSFSGEGKSTVNPVSRTLNSVANGFFKPLSYLAGGIDVVDSKTSQDTENKFKARFTNASEDHPVVKGVKGLASLVLCIPGGILGLLFKGVALLSPGLRKEYQAFDDKLLKSAKELGTQLSRIQTESASTPKESHDPLLGLAKNTFKEWLNKKESVGIDLLLNHVFSLKNDKGTLLIFEHNKELFRDALREAKEELKDDAKIPSPPPPSRRESLVEVKGRQEIEVAARQALNENNPGKLTNCFRQLRNQDPTELQEGDRVAADFLIQLKKEYPQQERLIQDAFNQSELAPGGLPPKPPKRR